MTKVYIGLQDGQVLPPSHWLTSTRTNGSRCALENISKTSVSKTRNLRSLERRDDKHIKALIFHIFSLFCNIMSWKSRTKDVRRGEKVFRTFKGRWSLIHESKLMIERGLG